MIKSKKFNSTILFIIIILTCFLSNLYANSLSQTTTTTTEPSIGDFQIEDRNVCYLSTPSAFADELDRSVNSFKESCTDDSLVSIESLNLIDLAESFAYLEVKALAKQITSQDIEEFQNKYSTLINKHPELSELKDLSVFLSGSERNIKIKVKKVTDNYRIISQNIGNQDGRPFYFIDHLADSCIFASKSVLFRSLKDQDKCLDLNSINRYDEIYEDLNTETVTYEKCTSDKMSLTKENLTEGAYRLGFWLKLSLDLVKEGNKNVFNYTNGDKTMSLQLAIGEDGVSIDHIFKVGDKSYTINNSSPCSDLEFITLNVVKQFNNYLIKLVIKSTHLNDRKAIEITVPASYIEFGTFTFSNSNLVRLCDIFHVKLVTPGYCKEQLEVELLQEIELITQIIAEDVTLTQKLYQHVCNTKPDECAYYTYGQCLVCEQDYFLSETTCVKECEEGFYENTESKTCEPCKENCKACDDPDTCTSCTSDKFLYKGNCVVTCPSYTYPVEGKCEPCTNDCEVCSGVDTCSKCKTYFLYNQKCVETCPEKTFTTTNPNACKNCGENCAKCTSASSCTICDSGYYLLNGACVTDCPLGKFKCDKTGKCQDCPAECLECENKETCTVCANEYNLHNKKCITDCPSGYVPKNNVCIPCGGNCKICNPENTTICYECDNTHFLKNSKCVTDCGDEYYADNSRHCKKCLENCLDCENAETCKECKANFFNFKGEQCINVCPDGWAGKDKNCVPCEASSNCKTCDANNLSTCITCFEEDFMNDGICVEVCPKGTYTDGKTCKKCHETCETCNNGNSCITCKSGLLLKNGQCVTDCGDGYTDNSVNCTPCTVDDCQVCNTAVDYCDKCKNKFLFSGVCLDNCVEGTYPTDDYQCKPCFKDCKLCQNATTCDECIGDLVLSVNKEECLEKCPDKTVEIAKECNPCLNSNCKNCSTDKNTCTQCEEGDFLYNKDCVRECPSGYIPNTQTGRCDPCTSPCLQCKGNVDYCTSCIDNYVLLPDNTCSDNCPEFHANVDKVCKPCNNKNCKVCSTDLQECSKCNDTTFLYDANCVPTCPVKHYEDKETRKCLPCSDNCDICECENKCLVCSEGSVLFENACIDKCPNYYVPVNENNGSVCVPCKGSCLKCNVENTNVCLECDETTFLHNEECVTNCPNGYRQNVVDRTCKKCSVQYCSKCVNNIQECSKCQTGLFLLDNTCVPECPEGYREEEGKCYKCNVEDCVNCDSSVDTCDVCKNYKLSETLCADTCPAKTYPVPASQSCNPCNPLCQSCINSNVCTSCINEFFLRDDGVCVEICEDGYVGSPSSGNCEPCDNNCLKCLPGDQTSCTECTNGTFLFTETNKCVAECPEGYFECEKSKKCQPCNVSCATCSNKTSCDTCKENLVYHEGKCIDNCPAFYANVNGTCTECNTSAMCLKCSAQNLNNCIDCGEYILFQDRCREKCPDGYYKLTNNTCEKCTENCRVCDNSETCNICSGTYKLLPNGKCAEKCDDGYVAINNVCERCNDKLCKVCSQDKNCVKCLENNYLKLVDGQNICVDNCGEGYYLEVDTCKKCSDENCKICTNSTSCDECKVSFSLLNNTTCVKECPEKMVSINKECEFCGDNCLKCSNTDKDKCYTCEAPYVLHNDNCLESCPEGYVELASKPGVCTECTDPNCIKCSKNDNNICEVCDSKYLLNHLGACVTTCSDGYTAQESKCAPCNVDECLDCEGNVETCLTCKPPKNNLNGYCLDECPETMYAKNYECKLCDNCPVCENETGLCKECYIGYFLTSFGTCKTNCVEGKVRVGDECVPCSVQDCKSCPANDVGTCKECKENKKLYNNVCYDVCPEGTFESTNNICLDCSQDCKICENENKCTICNIGKVLQGNVCKNVCDIGFVDVNGICEECTNSNNCARCNPNQKDQCVKCKDTFFLKGTTCVVDCGEGYYVDGTTCKACETNCKKCIDDNTCTLCYDNFVLHNTDCIDKCPTNYVEVNKVCKKCTNSLCLECSKENQDICIKCDPSKFLKNNQCVDFCGLGFYANEAKTCLPCEDPNCLTCCPKSKQCKDCKNDFFLHDGACLDKCPDGYVPDSSDVCTKCNDSKCKVCKASNLDYCNECSEGVLQGSICKDVCDLGFYEVDKVCVPCASGCLECVNGSKCDRCESPLVLSGDKCVSICPDGFVAVDGKCIPCEERTNGCIQCETNTINCTKCEFPKILYVNKCVEICPDFFFSDGGSCNPCEGDCKTCQDASECQVCSEGTYMFKSDCYNPCPEYTYPKESTKTCEYCTDSEKCVTCNSSNPDVCTKCSSGILYLGKCIDKCPPETFYNETSKTCEPCESNCELCSSGETCNKCKNGHFLYNNDCVEKCPVGHVDVGNVCKPCATNCATCSASNLEKCTTCLGDLVLYQDKCIPKCPAGTFQTTNVNNVKICSPCSERCLTCTSLTSCQSCVKPLLLNGDKCVDECPNGTANVNDVCRPCTDSVNCLKCSSDDLGKCIDCKDELFLLDGTCKENCPQGYYNNTVDKTCKKCNTSCLSCTNSTQCTVCASGYHFKEGTFDCVICPLNTHVVVGDECRTCKVSYCDKCVASDDKVCDVCAGNRVLIDGECKESCPVGHYQVGQFCYTCSNGCIECTDETKCNKCSELMFLLDNECVEQCPSGYGYDDNKNCKKCTVENCKECNGNTPDVCVKCEDDIYLHDNTCKNDCPEGHYPNEEEDKCYDCPVNCKHCSEDGAKCDECMDGFYLKEGVCVNTCGEGYFKVEVAKQCNPCSTEGCESCGNNTCTKCLDGLMLFIKDGVRTCVANCETGYYKATENGADICKKCGTACAQCVDNETCVVCADEGLVLYNGKCINECPIQYTRVVNKCEPCTDTSCELCQPNSPNICDKCLNGYLLVDHCVEECPVGYYTDNINKTCKKCNERCLTCTNKDTCTKCKTEFVLNDGVCHNECPNGKYAHNGNCLPCNIDNCDSCVLSGSTTKCTDCNENTYLFEGKCVPDCPPKHYADSDRKCAPCKVGCKECTSSDVCTICEDSYFMYKDKCLVFCPEHTYHACETKECKDCAIECQSCYSDKPSTCFRCAFGYIKGADEVCVEGEACPEGFFSDPLTRNCVKCELDNCARCKDAQTCLRCDGESELVDGECVTLPKSLVQVFDEAVLQTPLAKNYAQNVSFKFSDLTNISVNKTLYMTFNIRDLKVTENLNETEESVYLTAYLNNITATFYNNKKDNKCYLRILINNQSKNLNLGDCSAKDLFDWKVMAFGFKLESDNELLVQSALEYTEVVSEYIDLSIPITKLLNEESYISVLEENTLGNNGSQIGKLKIINYEMNGDTYKNALIDKPPKLNWSCEASNDQCTSGFIPLGDVVIATENIKLSNKALKNKYQAAFSHFGYAGYHYIFESKEGEEINLVNIKYPYQNAPLGEVNALSVVLTDNDILGNNVFNVNKSALQPNKWYYVRAIIENTEVGAKYTLTILNGNLEVVVNQTKTVQEEYSFITKLFVDAVVSFSKHPQEIIKKPIILTNSLGPQPEPIQNFSVDDNCLELGSDFKCKNCKDMYVLSDDGLCVDDAVNNGEVLFNYIEAYNNNSEDVSIPDNYAQKDYTIYFALRKLVHSISKPELLPHDVLGITTDDGSKFNLISQTPLPDYKSYFTIQATEFSLDLGDVYYDFLNVLIVYKAEDNMLSVTVYDQSKSYNQSNKLPGQIKTLTFFDNDKTEIHLEAVDGKIYPKALSDDVLKTLGNRKLANVDPLCVEPNYETGACNRCIDKTINEYRCATGIFGLDFLQLFGNAELNEEIATYSLKSKLSHSVNSSRYSLTSRFNIYSLPEGQDDTYELINLRNKSHLENESVDPSNNLIALKIKVVSGVPQVVIILNNSVEETVIVPENYEFELGKWNFFFGTLNVKDNTFSYVLTNNEEASVNTNDLTNYGEKLQNIGELSIFGANSNNAGLQGETKHTFVIPNPPEDISRLIDYLKDTDKYVPKVPEKIENCKFTVYTTETETMCVVCEDGFSIEDGMCVETIKTIGYHVLDNSTVLQLFQNKEFTVTKPFDTNKLIFSIAFRANNFENGTSSLIANAGSVNFELLIIDGFGIINIGEDAIGPFTSNIFRNWNNLYVVITQKAVKVCLIGCHNAYKKECMTFDNAIDSVPTSITLNNSNNNIQLAGLHTIQNDDEIIGYSVCGRLSCNIECYLCQDGVCLLSNADVNEKNIEQARFIEVVSDNRSQSFFSSKVSESYKNLLRTDSYSLKFLYKGVKDETNVDLFKLNLTDDSYIQLTKKTETEFLFKYIVPTSSLFSITLALPSEPLNAALGIVLNVNNNKFTLLVFDSIDNYRLSSTSLTIPNNHSYLTNASEIIFANNTFDNNTCPVTVSKAEISLNTALDESQLFEVAKKLTRKLQNACAVSNDNSQICTQCIEGYKIITSPEGQNVCALDSGNSFTDTTDIFEISNGAKFTANFVNTNEPNDIGYITTVQLPNSNEEVELYKANNESTVLFSVYATENGLKLKHNFNNKEVVTEVPIPNRKENPRLTIYVNINTRGNSIEAYDLSTDKFYSKSYNIITSQSFNLLPSGKNVSVVYNADLNNNVVYKAKGTVLYVNAVLTNQNIKDLAFVPTPPCNFSAKLSLTDFANGNMFNKLSQLANFVSIKDFDNYKFEILENLTDNHKTRFLTVSNSLKASDFSAEVNDVMTDDAINNAVLDLLVEESKLILNIPSAEASIDLTPLGSSIKDFTHVKVQVYVNAKENSVIAHALFDNVVVIKSIKGKTQTINKYTGVFVSKPHQATLDLEKSNELINNHDLVYETINNNVCGASCDRCTQYVENLICSKCSGDNVLTDQNNCIPGYSSS